MMLLKNRLLKKRKLLQQNSLFDLEKLLGKPVNVVDDIIDKKSDHITEVEIPKKDGSPRKITSPSSALKYMQRSIGWKILRRYKSHNAAHGFVPKRGISTNADAHVGAKSLGKIDISKFFDSISEKHLKNVLFGNKNICRYCKHYERMLDGHCNPSLYKNKVEKFKYRCEEIKAVWIPDYCEKTGYQSLIKRIIEICTNKGFAAQGFPTSPALANIVLRGFDRDISEYCDEYDIAYTRYADDLTFSSKTLEKDELRKIIQRKVIRQLWAYGFKPNKKKTSFKGKAGRLRVCGVVVNEKKNVQRSVVHLFRAKVHNATVKFAAKTTKTRIKQLKGFASFIMSINRKQGAQYMNKLIEFEKAKFK